MKKKYFEIDRQGGGEKGGGTNVFIAGKKREKRKGGGGRRRWEGGILGGICLKGGGEKEKERVGIFKLSHRGKKKEWRNFMFLCSKETIDLIRKRKKKKLHWLML